jgi:ubiquinone biosynthesis protein COQ9
MEEFLQIARQYEGPWDENLMSFIATNSGITPQALKLFLPSGLETLVDLYFNSIESSLFLDPKLDTIQSKVYSLLIQIFTTLEKDSAFSRRLLSLPLPFTRKSRLVLRGAKRIWDLVDIATDFSYYSRIASLSFIYGRNLLVFSEGKDWSAGLQQDFKQLGRVINLKKKLFT